MELLKLISNLVVHQIGFHQQQERDVHVHTENCAMD